MTTHSPDIPLSTRRTLSRYGISTPAGSISGTMMRMALVTLSEETSISNASREATAHLLESRSPISEWAEELAGISYRRNFMERSLRYIVINFLRMSALSSRNAPSAKTVLLASVPDRRKAELEPFNVDAIAEKLFWLELIAIINKNWTLFERIFGDKTAFNENANIVNDRPDAHAKHLEATDIAMHRRALQWLEDRIARV